jgi:hypothetical protein|tara:strand:+ start:1182 stop:1355 length:174 start_codon:yes stop_codon:yes gene_type:complete
MSAFFICHASGTQKGTQMDFSKSPQNRNPLIKGQEKILHCWNLLGDAITNIFNHLSR